MRKKYRSAVYTFSKAQELGSEKIINNFQKEFDKQIITKVYPFHSFKASNEAFQNYYQKNPKKPFCETFINPKLKLLLDEFSNHVNTKKVMHLNTVI